MLLLPSSCHLPSVTRGTVYGLALRVRRIDSKPNEADEDFDSLKGKLLEREYDVTVVEAGIKKARKLTREEALQRAEKNRKKEVDEKAVRQHRFIRVRPTNGPKVKAGSRR